MVRFCNKCKRAIDDTDKFCRACGHGTDNSIDYHTYYNLFEKGDNAQQSLYWFNIGKDIAIRKELADIRTKVDIMYEKLFPSPVKELMEINEKVIDIPEEITAHEEITTPEHQDIKDEEITTPEHQDIKDEETQEYQDTKDEETIPEHQDTKDEEVTTPEHQDTKDEETPEYKDTKDDENEDNDWAWKDENPPSNQEIKGDEVSQIQDKKDDNTPEIKVDNPDTPEIKVDNPDTVHEEADAKLGALLGPEDKGQRDALRYLIHKYSKKDNNSGEEYHHKDVKAIDKNVITIIPKEDITREHTRGRGKGETRGIYHDAIFKFIPDILKEIEHSNDGRIRVKISDIAEKMGEQFVGKKNVTIYTGLKYSLFYHNIVVEQGTLKEIDPNTKENIKVLIMRMRNPDDKLPPSKLKRKKEYVEVDIDERLEKK